LDKAFTLARKIEREIIETRNPTTHDYNYGSVFLLAFHNLQHLHHSNWKKKEKKAFVTIVIANTLKVISVLKINYFT